MRGYFLKRVSFLQCLSIFFLGFSLAVGNLLFGFITLLLAVGLDALNGFLQRDKRK